MTGGMPTYRLRHLPIRGDVPAGIRREFEEFGLPDRLVGFEYALRSEPVVVDSQGERDLWFADCGPHVAVHVELLSGRVLTTKRKGPPDRLLVNSSVHLFRECIEIVSSRFPFYDDDAEIERIESVADGIEELISGIDEIALRDDGFWATYISDMRIGDYAPGLIS
jgi:SUKH-4 immunity protein